MRRIAITTPNVMAALRKLDRNRARPYNFAISPVLVNLSNEAITLLGHFEKDPSKWRTIRYVNICDGSVHTLNPPTLLALPQTFEMIFSQYHRHPEYKSLAPDGSACQSDTKGLLRRCHIVSTGIRLIGKETERAWEQVDDVSTLLPSLTRYGTSNVVLRPDELAALRKIPLNVLDRTGLSRHTIRASAQAATGSHESPQAAPTIC